MLKILVLAITLKVEGAMQEKRGSFRIDLDMHGDVILQTTSSLLTIPSPESLL